MYIYTDDDLTKINRDYLGPRGKRLPWVWTYRTYGVVLAVVVGLLAVFIGIGVPLNQWTGLAFCFTAFLLSTYVVRRLNGDVGIIAMFQAGWQEVKVPRAPRPSVEDHEIRATVQKFDYDAVPPLRWWEFSARRAAKPGQHPAIVSNAPTTASSAVPASEPAEPPLTRRTNKQRALARK